MKNGIIINGVAYELTEDTERTYEEVCEYDCDLREWCNQTANEQLCNEAFEVKSEVNAKSHFKKVKQ